MNLDVIIGDIRNSENSAVIAGTVLEGGEEAAKALAGFEPAFSVDGPVWTKENGSRTKELYAAAASLFEKACKKQVKTLDLAALPSGDAGSELFQAASDILRAYNDHMRENEYPEKLTIVCTDEYGNKMYRMAYNYWFAVDHDTRLEVEHEHEHE